MRNNLVKRSYYKEAMEVPKGKNSYRVHKLVGEDFTNSTLLKNLSNKNNGKNDSNNSKQGTTGLSALSVSGEKVLKKFIEENNKRDQQLKQQEEAYYKYKHSKPAIEYNPWKYTNSVGKEFSVAPGDKIHSFKKELKDTRVKKPFYRPSDYGDYFSKIDLSSEFDKFKK